jgi:hypothetical protein
MNFPLPGEALAALRSLGGLRPGLRSTNADQLAKQARRRERWRRFLSSGGLELLAQLGAAAGEAAERGRGAPRVANQADHSVAHSRIPADFCQRHSTLSTILPM